jgi:hypothetical protein
MELLDKINQVANDLKDQFGGTIESVPDWAISDKLNESIITLQTVYKSVKTRDIKTILILAQELFNIVDYISNGENESIKNICYSVNAVLSELEALDLNQPEYLATFQQIAANLFQANLISAPTKTRLEALIVPETKEVLAQSWAQLNNIQIDTTIIGLVRGGMV